MQRRHGRRLAVCIPIALALQLAGPAGWLAPAAAKRRTMIDRVERATVRLINAIRSRHGLGRLRLSRSMSRGAAMHSRWMARSGVLTHGAWASRLAHFARSRTTGEVVGYVSGCSGRAQARYIVSLWMHSTEHRRILLSGRYHRLGIGRAGRGRTFFTVDVAG